MEVATLQESESNYRALHACFGTRNALKFSFDNCKGVAMLVDSCFSAGKIRSSCFFTRGGAVEVVQACFKTRNVLKFSFDSCSCVMLIDSCFSGEVR